MLARGHREDPRLVGQLTDVGHFTHEDVADLGSVAVDRRHQDVAGPVMAELDDQLCEVGLDRGDALGFQMLVEADLLGRHRFDLDHVIGAGRLDQAGDDAIGFVGVARPMHHATARRDIALELLKQLRQAGHHILLKRTARKPQLLPVGAFTHRRKPFGSNGAGRVADVMAHLRVSQRTASRTRKRLCAAQVTDTGSAQKRGHRAPSAATCSVSSVAARISAR